MKVAADCNPVPVTKSNDGGLNGITISNDGRSIFVNQLWTKKARSFVRACVWVGWSVRTSHNESPFRLPPPVLGAMGLRRSVTHSQSGGPSIPIRPGPPNRMVGR